MDLGHRFRGVAVGALALHLLAASAAQALPAAPAARDPLAAAIADWQEKIRSTPSADAEVKAIRDASAGLLGEADQALAQGRRWLALSRLERVWTDLEA
ncbi:MAG: hypothetical protein ABIV06_08150, partial [Thermoanaerobaculia bacterium]